MLLAACLPTIQHAGNPAEGFSGPRFDVANNHFVSFDGTELGLTAWLPPNGQEPSTVVIALHGMNDYAGTFYYAGPWFAAHGVATYAYDARGFGRSPQRGVWGGERLMTEDVRTAVRVARQMYPNAKIAVMGDSMGSAEAIATFGAPNAPHIDRLVLVAPAVWGWSTMPLAYRVGLWTSAHTLPWQAVQPPRGVVRHVTASDNQEALNRAGRDPNMIWTTRFDTLYGLVNLMEEAMDQSSNLNGNVLFLYGGHDQIIPRNSALATARRLPRTVRTAFYADGYHWLLRDNQSEVTYRDILAYLEDADAPLPSQAPPLLPVVQANR